MAKLSTVIKAERKKKMFLKLGSKRAELRKAAVNENLTDEERDLAFRKLQKMPRSSSVVRVRNRCALTGRGRGCYRKFGISRIKFRELANEGMIPGVTKASW